MGDHVAEAPDTLRALQSFKLPSASIVMSTLPALCQLPSFKSPRFTVCCLSPEVATVMFSSASSFIFTFMPVRSLYSPSSCPTLTSSSSPFRRASSCACESFLNFFLMFTSIRLRSAEPVVDSMVRESSKSVSLGVWPLVVLAPSLSPASSCLSAFASRYSLDFNKRMALVTGSEKLVCVIPPPLPSPSQG